jgi:hypothetical protein
MFLVSNGSVQLQANTIDPQGVYLRDQLLREKSLSISKHTEYFFYFKARAAVTSFQYSLTEIWGENAF